MFQRFCIVLVCSSSMTLVTRLFEACFTAARLILHARFMLPHVDRRLRWLWSMFHWNKLLQCVCAFSPFSKMQRLSHESIVLFWQPQISLPVRMAGIWAVITRLNEFPISCRMRIAFSRNWTPTVESFFLEYCFCYLFKRLNVIIADVLLQEPFDLSIFSHIPFKDALFIFQRSHNCSLRLCVSGPCTYTHRKIR